MNNEDLEVMDRMKEMPKWISENEDGTYTIETKDGKFIMEEQTGEVMEKVNKLAEKINVDSDTLLVARSIKEPKVSDEALKNFKGSTYLKLKTAIAYVYDMQDFF